MIPTKMIGIAGPLESGKDAVASILREYGYTQMSYGKYIRAEAGQGKIPHGYLPNGVMETLHMLQRCPNRMELVHAKPTTPQVRELIQWWGEWRFSIDGHYWNNLLGAELINMPQGNGRIVISDIRRPVEYYFVAGLKGENWKIERIMDQENPFRKHATETALLHYKFDVEICNDQDLIRLRHCVVDSLRTYDPEAYDSRRSRKE